MEIKVEKSVDFFENDESSKVFQIIPDCHKDNRGYFMEVFKETNDEFSKIPNWMRDSKWIRQVNRSSSTGGVIRGCHAQKGKFCQGKLVEAVNEKIYDIITDARPDSDSFGTSMVFLLDPEIHNKLWVPRGFLHAFVVPFSVKNPAIFEYYCDNVYDHSSEIEINPVTILPEVVRTFKELMWNSSDDYNDLYEVFEKKDSCVYSEKDMKGRDYQEFISEIRSDYEKRNKVWYR